MSQHRYNGIIPIYKESGWTSHDVVSKLRNILRQKKIGHTGTLDPAAEGVLILCLGQATKHAQYIQNQPKRYICDLTLGTATDTEDQTGNITLRYDGKIELDRDAILKVIAQFTGDITQVPPMYSAVKINGQKLYELARENKVIERPERKVHIYSIDLLDVSINDGVPVIRLDVECSKGTYIRTLCVDIGKALGFPAHMSYLVRISNGQFTIKECHTINDVVALKNEGKIESAIHEVCLT